MARRSTFSVSFRHVDGTFHDARRCTTRREANRWFRYYAVQAYCREAFLHQGEPGACLLDAVKGQGAVADGSSSGDELDALLREAAEARRKELAAR